MIRYITPFVLGAFLLMTGCDNGAKKATMADLNDSASYAFGVNVASAQLVPTLQQLSAQNIEFNRELIAQAIHDILVDTANGGMLNDSSAQAVLMRWQENMMATKKKENTDFLDENKSKAGVQTTPSGLQYKVVQEGSGEPPTAGDSVVVKYKGTLIDGTVFDETPEGETRTFSAGGLIEGWKEALTMMKPGAKWTLYVPSNLAYGDQGTPGIPPGATLIFDMELVDVK